MSLRLGMAVVWEAEAGHSRWAPMTFPHPRPGWSTHAGTLAQIALSARQVIETIREWDECVPRG